MHAHRRIHRAATITIAIGLVVASADPTRATWSSDPTTNVSVADGPSDQTQAKLVPTGDGRVFMSWLDGIASGYDVRIQLLTAAGDEFLGHNGELVADRGFSSTQDYGLALMATGDALLAFRDDRPGGTQITAARIATSGATLWGPDGIILTNTTDFVAAPVIAGTADGDVVVAWTQDTSVHVQRLDSNGTPRWVSDVVLTPGAGSYSVADMHASGIDVIVSIVHQTGGFSSPKHLLAQKVDDDGALPWGSSPVAVFDGGSLQFGNFPDFVPDASGGAVFSWYDAGTLDFQCYVQRLNSAGAEMFAHNGVPVSTNATRIRVSPTAAFDAASDLVVSYWVEQNAGQSMWGVYGQGIDAAGARTWGAEGTEVVPVGSDAVGLVRTTILSSGSFVFWASAPSFGTDVLLGARLTTGGVVDLPAFDVSSTPSSKSRLAAVASSPTQAVLVWTDDRADGGDILAQNVNGDGSLGDGTIGVFDGDVGMVLRVARPTPTSGSVLIPLDASDAPVEVQILDVTGRRVRTLRASAAARELIWDGRGEDGLPAPTGVYHAIVATVGGTSAISRTQRIVIVR